jgi:hypothetical protein
MSTERPFRASDVLSRDEIRELTRTSVSASIN